MAPRRPVTPCPWSSVHPRAGPRVVTQLSTSWGTQRAPDLAEGLLVFGRQDAGERNATRRCRGTNGEPRTASSQVCAMLRLLHLVPGSAPLGGWTVSKPPRGKQRAL